MKQITLKIMTDGRIEAETHGIMGKSCLDYIGLIEQLTGAHTVDSAFTPDYKREVHLDVEIIEEVNA